MNKQKPKYTKREVLLSYEIATGKISVQEAYKKYPNFFKKIAPEYNAIVEEEKKIHEALSEVTIDK